jgi:hypothetical protein
VWEPITLTQIHITMEEASTTITEAPPMIMAMIIGIRKAT